MICDSELKRPVFGELGSYFKEVADFQKLGGRAGIEGVRGIVLIRGLRLLLRIVFVSLIADGAKRFVKSIRQHSD